MFPQPRQSLYRGEGLMLGKRAVRGDEEGAAQYTLAAGKQTQNIDYIIFTGGRSSTALDVYPARSKQARLGLRTSALHSHFARRAPPITLTLSTPLRYASL